MIKIEINDTIIRIPSSWEDITLADYEQWYNYKPENKLEYVHFVADICKLDKDFLLNSPTQLFDVIVDKIGFVFDDNIEPSSQVDIDGQTYFISLSSKLTLGEWVDIESTLASDSTTKISEMMAIVCRPAGEGYNGDIIGERKSLFRKLSCDKALPLIAFFLRRKKESEAILHHYSTVLGQTNQFLRDTKAFAISGGGIKQLPIWQRIRYTYLIRSLEKQLSKFSDFSSIDPISQKPKKSSRSLFSK